MGRTRLPVRFGRSLYSPLGRYRGKSGHRKAARPVKMGDGTFKGSGRLVPQKTNRQRAIFGKGEKVR